MKQKVKPSEIIEFLEQFETTAASAKPDDAYFVKYYAIENNDYEHAYRYELHKIVVTYQGAMQALFLVQTCENYKLISIDKL